MTDVEALFIAAALNAIDSRLGHLWLHARDGDRAALAALEDAIKDRSDPRSLRLWEKLQTTLGE